MGFPSPAQDYVEGRLTLATLSRLNPNSTYLVRSASDYPAAGIKTGSILAVDRSIDPKHGHLIIAEIGGEFVIRRLLLKPFPALQELAGAQTAHPLNNCPDVFNEEDSPVWGVVAYALTDVSGVGFSREVA